MVYCISKLLRQKFIHQGLCLSMERLQRAEAVRNIEFGKLPSQESRTIQDILVKVCFKPLMEWSAEVESREILGRLSNVRKEIQDMFPLFLKMFNRLDHKGAGHVCALSSDLLVCLARLLGTKRPSILDPTWGSHGMEPDRSGPCCLNVEATLFDMQRSLVCLTSFLRAGSPDPNAGKWFSVAWRLRALLACTLVHNLLPRAWKRRFSTTLRSALATAAKDDADLGRNRYRQDNSIHNAFINATCT